MSEAAVAMVRQYAEQGQSAAELRRTMVDRQLRPFDVTDVPLLERFLNVPRELFLPAGQETLAYSDLAVTVRGAGGHRRTLLPPLVLARLLQGGAPRPGQKALVIGGAGYSAAILSGLVGEVVALESDPELAARARRRSRGHRRNECAGRNRADGAGLPGFRPLRPDLRRGRR